ncbi:MAG: hypothetical protein JSW55_01545, partial [Chloroflexota bacterium]
WFLPEDVPDWYEFDLAFRGQMVVHLRNFTPGEGQIVVYRGNACGEWTRIINNGDPGTSKTLDLGTRDPGHYFIFVGSDGPKSLTDRYMLRVSVTP